jgi:hypothetical protein
MWSADADATALFETRTWQTGEPLAASELGRAFASPDATWLTGIDHAEDRRLVSAAREGMHSAALVPVRSGSTHVALLELLSREELSPDADLAAAMDAVAVQLGHFWYLLQLVAEPHWRLGRL